MKRVLVIEDHADTRELLCWQMELLGLSVISASNGKEGVEKAVRERPDLIVMDILMPVMDGREAIRLLRSNPQTQHIPILVATVLFRDADLKGCLEAGGDDYLTKPFTLRELKSKVGRFVSAPAESDLYTK